jgi:hypothetical protein
MSIPPSGDLPLPQWAYVPGETDAAAADYETLAQVKLLVPSAFRGFVPARHPALRYGLALNDRGYFWEAQEILETVWAAAPQGGRERILLRACIRIANANLRLRIGKLTAAALALRKATATGDGFADGFPTDALVAVLKARLERPVLSKTDWVPFAAIGRT